MMTIQQARNLVADELLESSVIAAKLGYGEPLFLDFARPDQGAVKKDATALCCLDTNFAEWSIEGAITANQERDAREHLERAAASLIETAVEEVTLEAGGGLIIRLTESHLLTINPWPSCDGYSDAWSMSLPDQKNLAVSNSGQVVIVDKHMPCRDWFAGI